MNLEHGDRQRFIDEISAINRQMNETTEAVSSSSRESIPLQFWGG